MWIYSDIEADISFCKNIFDLIWNVTFFAGEALFQKETVCSM